MVEEESPYLSEFITVHDDFLQNWHVVMRTGMVDRLHRFYGEDYFVTFLPRAHQHPSVEDRTSAMDGMHQSVESHRGVDKNFENRIVRKRSNTNMVVFYEQVLTNQQFEVGRLFTIEDWESVDGVWMIVRETVEVV